MKPRPTIPTASCARFAISRLASQLSHGFGNLIWRSALDARVGPCTTQKRHDEQNFFGTWCIGDGHRHRVHGIVIPCIVQAAENDVDRGACNTDLSVARDKRGTAARALTHGDPDADM